MKYMIPYIILLSLIPRFDKRPPTINPPPIEIASGEAFGITDWQGWSFIDQL